MEDAMTKFPEGTTGARLGIVRTELRKINNLDWLFSFNAAGEMVCAAPSDEFYAKVLEKHAPVEADVFIRAILPFLDEDHSIDAPINKVYDEDDDASDIAHPADSLIKAPEGNFTSVGDDVALLDDSWETLLADSGWTPEEKTHADNVEVEQCGKALWRYTYKGGQLINQELNDPELGKLFFDGKGDEIAA
jgi:hypothetical protein